MGKTLVHRNGEYQFRKMAKIYLFVVRYGSTLQNFFVILVRIEYTIIKNERLVL